MASKKETLNTQNYEYERDFAASFVHAFQSATT